MLVDRLPERHACRTMVELLAIAHERGCESELADQLDASLQARRLPDMAALRERFAPDPSRLPNAVVRLASLNAYEALIGASLTGERSMKTNAPVDAARLSLLLNELRLPASKVMWPQFAEQADKEGWPAARFLAEARLLPGKTLDTFEFEAVPMISKAQVMAITAGDSWLETGANLLLFGPPGGGKSHLASDIGLALIENGWRVMFTRTTDLVQKLQVARRELGLEAAINRLDRFHLLILDDLAYVTKDQAETSVLFELISARYERRSMLITANQPFGEWGKVFPDLAMTLAAFIGACCREGGTIVTFPRTYSYAVLHCKAVFYAARPHENYVLAVIGYLACPPAASGEPDTSDRPRYVGRLPRTISASK
jgi:hypothetical protein